jgi:hypothetical protein
LEASLAGAYWGSFAFSHMGTRHSGGFLHFWADMRMDSMDIIHCLGKGKALSLI